MIGWGGGAGWGAWAFMILAMLAFWVMVVVATTAILRGVHDDSAVRRDRSVAAKNPDKLMDRTVGKPFIQSGHDAH